MTKAPEDLSDLEYARHILEEVLGWPARGNLEMMADCLRSLGKAKKLIPAKAHTYMLRAIRLAGEQGIMVDRFFFLEGVYTTVRPKLGPLAPYERIDWGAVKREQASAEWQEWNYKLRSLLAQVAGKKAMP